MNQRGFATLEVILMVIVIGILASIAIPRFTDITMKANVAKIQADLSTIDTAISIAIMDSKTITAGKVSANAELANYLNDYNKIKPPTGTVYVKSGTSSTSTSVVISATDDYEINSDFRAVLKTYTAGDFTTEKPTT